jgi:hypothetical protein
LASELKRIEWDTVIGCGKFGERAASHDTEYDHVWGEQLVDTELNKLAFVTSQDRLYLHRMTRKDPQTDNCRQGILVTCSGGSPVVVVVWLR